MGSTAVEQQRDTLYELISRRRSHRQFGSSAVSADALKRILVCAQGLNNADGGRGAPSAHALHPLGLTVIARRVQDMAPGTYAFDAQTHELHRTVNVPPQGGLLAVSLAEDTWLETAPVLIVITADYASALAHFADQQADGRRGARYIDVEAGAVAQSLYLAAMVEELGGVLVMGVDDTALSELITVTAGHSPVAVFCLGPCER